MPFLWIRVDVIFLDWLGRWLLPFRKEHGTHMVELVSREEGKGVVAIGKSILVSVPYLTACLPQLGAGHHDIACWGTGGPHHQGPGAADPIGVFMEAGGAGKHPGPEDPGGAAGGMGMDGEELGKA